MSRNFITSRVDGAEVEECVQGAVGDLTGIAAKPVSLVPNADSSRALPPLDIARYLAIRRWQVGAGG